MNQRPSHSPEITEQNVGVKKKKKKLILGKSGRMLYYSFIRTKHNYYREKKI